jgi:hypothetical protein
MTILGLRSTLQQQAQLEQLAFKVQLEPLGLAAQVLLVLELKEAQVLLALLEHQPQPMFKSLHHLELGQSQQEQCQ